MPRVLFVVSAAARAATAPPAGPRKDYTAITGHLQATVLDRSAIAGSRTAGLVARLLGAPAAQAWLAFRQHRAYDAILTDGEHIGLPLAGLLKLARASTAHITIGHRLVTRKKQLFVRGLGVGSHLTCVALHSRLQQARAPSALGIPTERLALVPYQVDTEFWRPQPVPEERLIASAGLEHRDYPTLFRAVAGLDARVVIGAASHWSHQANSALRTQRPENVEIGSFDYHALRALYARAALVVVPLYDVDFQAGVTTILEAMAMGKAVIVTHSAGQTDVVEDRRTVTRGLGSRARPASMLQELAHAAGVPLEPNGYYVLPGDAAALRRAVVHLLDQPAERARLGQAGRRLVERLLTVDHYAQRLGAVVEQACGAARSAHAGPDPAWADARPEKVLR